MSHSSIGQRVGLVLFFCLGPALGWSVSPAEEVVRRSDQVQVSNNALIKPARRIDPARHGGKTVEDWAKQLDDPDSTRRYLAVLALGQMEHQAKPALAKLIARMQDDALWVSLAAIQAAPRVGTAEQVTPALLRELKNPDKQKYVERMLLAMGDSLQPLSAQLVAAALEDHSPVLVKILGRFSWSALSEHLQLEGGSNAQRTLTLLLLARIDDAPPSLVPELVRSLDLVLDRQLALPALVHMNASAAVPKIAEQLHGEISGIPRQKVNVDACGDGGRDDISGRVERARVLLQAMNQIDGHAELKLPLLLELNTIPQLRDDALKGLGRLGAAARSAVPDMMASLNTAERSAVLATNEALIQILPTTPESIPHLIKVHAARLRFPFYDRPELAENPALVEKLRPLEKELVPELVRLLQHPEDKLMIHAAIDLVRIFRPEAAVPALVELCGASYFDMRTEVLNALVCCARESQAARDGIARLAQSDDAFLRRGLATALVHSDGKKLPGILPILMTLFRAEVSVEKPFKGFAPGRELAVAILERGDEGRQYWPELIELAKRHKQPKSLDLSVYAHMGPAGAPKLLEEFAQGSADDRRDLLERFRVLGLLGAAAAQGLKQYLVREDGTFDADLGETLQSMGPAGAEVLLPLLGDRRREIRLAAMEALWPSAPLSDDVATAFSRALGSLDSATRLAAANVLSQIPARSRVGLAELVAALDDPADEVRFAAAKALFLRGMHLEQALPAIIEGCRSADSRKRLTAFKFLADYAPPLPELLLPPLVEVLKAPRDARRGEVLLHVLQALGKLGPAAAPALPALDSEFAYYHPVGWRVVRDEINPVIAPMSATYYAIADREGSLMFALCNGKRDDEVPLPHDFPANFEPIVPWLVQVLSSSKPLERVKAARLLWAYNGDPRAAATLVELLENPGEPSEFPTPDPVQQAGEALARMVGAPSPVPHLVAALKHESKAHQLSAARALWKLTGDPAALSILIESGLQSDDMQGQDPTLVLLLERDARAAIPRLVEAIQGSDREVRHNAFELLTCIDWTAAARLQAESILQPHAATEASERTVGVKPGSRPESPVRK